MKLKISETFGTIQGEGRFTGSPSLFIRTSGCNLRCWWCLDGESRVLLADWTTKALKDVQVGEMVMGLNASKERNAHKYLAPTKVTAIHNNGVRKAITLRTATTSLTCTPEHMIYAKNGHILRWAAAGKGKAGTWRIPIAKPTQVTAEFRRGWCAGYIYADGNRQIQNGYLKIRAVSRDESLLETLIQWAAQFGGRFKRFIHDAGKGSTFGNPLIDGVICTESAVNEIFWKRITKAPYDPEYWKGWLAGMFDGEGTKTHSSGSCAISQSEKVHKDRCLLIEQALGLLEIPFSKQKGHDGMVAYILPAAQFQLKCPPQLMRKRREEFSIGSLPSETLLEVIKEERPVQVYDLTTESHSYVANGLVVHNCDTPYTSWKPEGEATEVEALHHLISKTEYPHVVLTGGEPMLYDKAMIMLCDIAHSFGKIVTIETNGTIWNELVDADLWSVSPKLASAAPDKEKHPREYELHQSNLMPDELIKFGIQALTVGNVQFKFVICKPEDLHEVATMAMKYELPKESIYLMPEGRDTATILTVGAWLAEEVKERKWNLCLRQQILLWGNKRGT